MKWKPIIELNPVPDRYYLITYWWSGFWHCHTATRRKVSDGHGGNQSVWFSSTGTSVADPDYWMDIPEPPARKE